MKLNYLFIGSRKIIWAKSLLKKIPGNVDGVIYPYYTGFIITDQLSTPRLFLYKECGSQYAVFTSVQKHNKRLRLFFSTKPDDSQYFDIEKLSYDEWIKLASKLYNDCSLLSGTQ